MRRRQVDFKRLSPTNGFRLGEYKNAYSPAPSARQGVGVGLFEGNFYYRSEDHHELSVLGQSRDTTFTVSGLVSRVCANFWHLELANIDEPTGLTKPGFRGDPNLVV